MDKTRQKITSYINWYNQHRPHEYLNGATPIEIYQNQTPANCQPRYEPRPHWPITSGCAAPQVEIKGQPGVQLQLVVTFLDNDKLLPIVELREVA